MDLNTNRGEKCLAFIHCCQLNKSSVMVILRFKSLISVKDTQSYKHDTPVFVSAPVEHYSSLGMKISIEIPMGIENVLFPAQKMPVGMVLECNFFN